MSGLYLRDLSW